ncbi:hypothetical protein NUW58_g10184 [Xylaria curta]|uniref:Uncharacterized protein n=1 Tax=Xylaria curta TaxID=42375 RepID=A0ACC1MPU4_9PEZI|nr:hypothetical protein NUW58_g10184 [Xylaria curta]
MGNWDAELIGLLPDSVRVFASAGAGFDWADVKLFGEKGIVYCNSGLAAAEAVADFSAAHESATGLSRNLRGHVLGLVGFGNIGQQIAHRCSAAFGMEITYYDVERKSAAVEAGLHARYCMTLESLIRSADCVVLCAPGLSLGARLVNVARGALVDQDALADALEQDRLSSVALDVHANEPHINERLKKLASSKALLTCHNAGGTIETHVGFEELCMRNIMAVLGGREPITPTNIQWLR